MTVKSCTLHTAAVLCLHVDTYWASQTMEVNRPLSADASQHFSTRQQRGNRHSSSSSHSSNNSMADLVEVPIEAILVVGNGGDEGEHEAPAAPHLTVPRAVLSVLPQRAIVLLVHADCLLDDHRLTCDDMTLAATHIHTVALHAHRLNLDELGVDLCKFKILRTVSHLQLMSLVVALSHNTEVLGAPNCHIWPHVVCSRLTCRALAAMACARYLLACHMLLHSKLKAQ